MFLTKEQVSELTGRKRTSSQQKWLKEHGWHFEENATGRPIVLATYAESMLGCGQHQKAETYQPNFNTLRKRS